MWDISSLAGFYYTTVVGCLRVDDHSPDFFWGAGAAHMELGDNTRAHLYTSVWFSVEVTAMSVILLFDDSLKKYFMSQKSKPKDATLTFKIRIPPKLTVLDDFKRKNIKGSVCQDTHSSAKWKFLPLICLILHLGIFFFFFFFFLLHLFSSNIKCQSHLHVLGATRVKRQTCDLLLSGSKSVKKIRLWWGYNKEGGNEGRMGGGEGGAKLGC